jgi:phospholipase C
VDSKGNYIGYSQCEATYNVTRPPVPYGSQSVSNSLVSEQGFKTVRGDLTEGRYLVIELNGYALSNGGNAISATKATAQHNAKAQRWVAHQLTAGGNDFTFSSAVDGKFVDNRGNLVASSSQAATWTVADLGNGKGYAVNGTSGYVQIGKDGGIGFGKLGGGFSLFSVTYS